MLCYENNTASVFCCSLEREQSQIPHYEYAADIPAAYRCIENPVVLLAAGLHPQRGWMPRYRCKRRR